MSAYKMLCRIIKDNGNFVSKEKASEALEDISNTFDKQQKDIEKLQERLGKANQIVVMLYEKEPGTTLKSKCWQMADKYMVNK